MTQEQLEPSDTPIPNPEKKDLSSINLNSDEERMELLRGWVSRIVSIKRSSGEIEHDWYVSRVARDGIVLAKDVGNLSKKVTLKDFAELNPDFFL